MEKVNVKAVITGDIIRSMRMSNDDRLGLMRDISKELKKWNKDFGMRSEIYRGDSFQCLLNKPASALRVALLIKTSIRSMSPGFSFVLQNKNNPTHVNRISTPFWIFDARIAISIGTVDLPTNQLATSSGEAFELSGKLLDRMKEGKQSIAIATNDEFNAEFETESILLDAIISKTSPMQCKVIELKLLGFNEIEIGKRLKIVQPAVNQRSRSGNWNAIETIVERFEYIYGNE